MDTLGRLSDISSRIDHLEQAAEWIAKETVFSDNPISQTSTLIMVLADDIREKLVRLIGDLERGIEIEKVN